MQSVEQLQNEKPLVLVQWLKDNVDQILAASNFTISIFLFILGSIVLYYIFRAQFSGRTDILYMMIGIVSEAYGWAIHRLYWGLWRYARLYQNEPMQQWFIDNAYLALIPALMVVTGLILILGPAISWAVDTAKRSKFYIITGILILSTWWFFYWQLEQGFVEEKARKAQNQKEKISTDIRKGIKILRPNKDPIYLNTQEKPLGPSLTNPNPKD